MKASVALHKSGARHKSGFFTHGFFVAFAALTLLVSSVHAFSNPLIRNCVINGGTFQVEPYGTDDMALCRWNQVVIDSQSLVSNVDGLATEAVSLILSNVVTNSCTAVLARPHTLADGQVLCVFTDESKLSIEALKAGLSDPNRQRLKEVLLSR